MSAHVQTHKEVSGYASKYDHDWPVSAVPRDPAEYQPVPSENPWAVSHYLAKIKERNVPGEAVRGCITEGTVHAAEEHNRYRFLWTDPASLATFSLIVELRQAAFERDSPKHYAVTAYHVEH